ncbi:uncharacterized protein LOC125384390 [Haliotis rufescens]|uniref:uncharacterized protein LOC125384390 n=1 Tax=Haliotis rufescens TaxID=6454 RepID=UPI00201EE968|nr:uncharacterized protein LOC125384390 [Haliotis rufescens]
MASGISEDEKCLKRHVLDLIGNLDEDTLNSIVDVLNTLGVTHVDDLKWVTPDDLVGRVKPVHARKLLSHSVSQPSRSVPSPSSSVDSSMSFSPKSPGPILIHNINTDPNWPVKLELPLRDVSAAVRNDLERGKRLHPSARQDLVRLFVDAVRKKTQHASRPQMSVIAQRMTARYPDSLQDKLDGSIIGSGYDSILNKLVSRNENLNRSLNASRMCLSRKKRPLASDSGSSDNSDNPEGGCAAAAAERRDSYGCINWMPVLTGDTECQDMEHHKNNLKAMYENSETDYEKVSRSMKASYALQRKEINSGTSMDELKEEWPYLFEVKGLLAHANELLGIDIRNALGTAYRDKAVRINRFFKTKSSFKCEMIYEEARRQSEKDNVKAWLVAVILCVLNHFGEKEKDVFFVVDETTSVGAAEKSTTKESLQLIVFGDSVLAGKTYMLMCDRMVISPMDRIQSFMDAFSAFFASFYVFNLEYPPGASTTMEFIQRCFIGINPDRGSKGNQGKRKKTKINPKVLSLINALADFEWLESDI